MAEMFDQYAKGKFDGMREKKVFRTILFIYYSE